MAKLSAINKNNRRIKLVNKYFKKRQELKKIVMNRCQITGRPHGVYRKLKISRIALRQLGLQGKIPGMVKSSW
jgi:small subunit ribosomal protein S14